jgi:hypothetical protein
LDGYGVAKFGTVCQEWCRLARDPSVWREVCFQVWKESHAFRLLPQFNHDWKRLFVELPHVRYDGLYILETIYWRPGGYGLEQHQKILKIAYYRVLRFFPDHKVLYALINGSCDSAAVAFSNEASQIIKHGHYKMSARGVELIVDCGHLTAKMVLSFDDCGCGINNRLTMVEFLGKYSPEDPPIKYKLPNSSFWFDKVDSY